MAEPLGVGRIGKECGHEDDRDGREQRRPEHRVAQAHMDGERRPAPPTALWIGGLLRASDTPD